MPANAHMRRPMWGMLSMKTPTSRGSYCR
jgi:hypothetical protein